jgi:hypothetical protein
MVSIRKGCKSKYTNPSRLPPWVKQLITLGNQPNELRNEYTPEPGSLQAQMLEPRNEGGAVLRERCRLQLPMFPSVCTYRPGRAHACCVRVSSPHEVLYLRPRNSANFQSKIRWEAQYLVQFSMKCAPHSLASPALRACRLACPGASSKERQAAREHARRSECLR